MTSELTRRRFLGTAGAGVATGAVSALGGESSSPPLPDAKTKVSADGTGPQGACCAPASKLIFACSGSADVGKIADLAARKLGEEAVGKMFCLAGVGGRVKGIMETTKAAKAILAIDGCPLHCARNTLQQAGFNKFEHLCLSDVGMEKGKTPATEKAVAKVAGLAKGRLVGS